MEDKIREELIKYATWVDAQGNDTKPRTPTERVEAYLLEEQPYIIIHSGSTRGGKSIAAKRHQFVYQNQDLVKAAKLNGAKSPEGIKMIALAREFCGYSPNTIAHDIYCVIINTQIKQP